MYHKILVPLENSPTDEVILKHVRILAKWSHARLLLAHVADGWVARNYDRLKMDESEEMKDDRAYLEKQAARLREEGYDVKTVLALGEPADEILKLAREHKADLIAMSTHGHRFIADFLYGSVAHRVRHCTDIPVLLIRAPADKDR